MSGRKRHQRSRRRGGHEEWEDLAATYRDMRRRRRPRRLYRDTENGMLGGVCAGLANYLGIEPWIVRVIFVTFMILGTFLIPLIVYVVLVLVLDPEPPLEDEWLESDTREAHRAAAATRVSPKLGLRVARADLRELELRLRRIERYVTSPKYTLDKGFSEMRGSSPDSSGGSPGPRW